MSFAEDIGEGHGSFVQLKNFAMKKKLLLFALTTFALVALAQRPATRAFIDEDGVIQMETVLDAKLPPAARDGLSPMPGFPLNFPSNTTYKPMRGVALADLNGDGADEIILSHNDQINVIDGQGQILWTQTLVGGMAQYPAAVGDIDGDGDFEIVVLTAYGNARGGINVFDCTGEVLYSEITANNPLITAPVLADLNNDGALEIIFCGRGKASASISAGIHAINLQGEELPGFPYELPSTPAITPTVADIDGDGFLELFAATTTVLHCFNHMGETLYTIDSEEAYKYSYQSPLVVDFEGLGKWSLVGACHGDNPNHYVRDAQTGEYREGWPKPVNAWTYSAPTVVKEVGQYAIFMGVSGEGNVFFQYDMDGNVASGFPLNLSSGIEGFISVADIDGDGKNEIVTSFNMMEDGLGYIRAWEMDGTEVTEGFPLRPQGLSFMNGANIGDIDGDGNMDIVTLTYDNNFSPDDPVYVTAYALNQPVENLVYGTYKGSNDRTGWIREEAVDVSCNPVRDIYFLTEGDTPWIGIYWELPAEGSTGECSSIVVVRDNEEIATLAPSALYYDDNDLNFEEFHTYSVIAVYDDGCEAATEPVEVQVLPGAGLVDDPMYPCSLYPNPSKDLIHVVGAATQKVEIFTVSGQRVLELDGVVETINVANLSPGLYFVRLSTINGEQNIKLFIEK